ncbi:MAG: hypothetical protein DCC67_12100 [Planctomycetota bacterium]|nr:MAG: hypothetical protein DCC67_12100 [Planctomycetota bacterium]
MPDSSAEGFQSPSRLALPLLALALCWLLGCGQEAELAPAQGKVLYNGQPLKFGSVMFQHEQGGQPSQAEIQPDGTFVLGTYEPGDGARIGRNQVAIYCYESQDPAKAAARSAGEQSLGRLLIPQRYAMLNTSGLSVEVKPEGNEPFVFNLTDKP